MYEIHSINPNPSISFPLFLSSVSAGFPSPAEDYIEKNLDLNELLIKHPAATFFVRVSGRSMEGAHIHDQDILIVDRSLAPSNGKIVLAVIEGNITVKRLQICNQTVYLLAENQDFPPLLVNPEEGVYIWGVITHIIHAAV
jgi:DNA polymerase V